jgi:hypothetical protein
MIAVYSSQVDLLDGARTGDCLTMFVCRSFLTVTVNDRAEKMILKPAHIVCIYAATYPVSLFA